jgi:hypothetical protein
MSYITPLFDKQASTYFGIHVPSSGSFSREHEKLPQDGTWMPKHVEACVSNKGVI